MKFSLAASLAFAAISTAHAHSHGNEEWDVLSDAQLPTPVSDHSSTFVPANVAAGTQAGIYIAGGCDSPNGNTYVDANGLELDFFLCESISDQLHIFNADTMTFTTSQAKLPRARYRHAAVHAKGKLWLVGGRTIPDDNIIPEVDVSICNCNCGMQCLTKPRTEFSHPSIFLACFYFSRSMIPSRTRGRPSEKFQAHF